MMEFDELKGLIELLKDTDITELMVEKNGSKVKIRREKFFTSIEMLKPQPVQFERKAEGAAPAASVSEEETQRLLTVTSPIVGTFYRSPSPDSGPFVETGSKVKKGQVICIIEAMKLMNEIESEVNGVVMRVLVENGHPVEYGEPLMLVEPE
jgi:acetyl-CoA carboxylase biotin carboxyl carrier protein